MLYLLISSTAAFLLIQITFIHSVKLLQATTKCDRKSPSLVDDGHEHNQTVSVHLSLNYSCPFPSQHKHPFISCCRINRQTADDCCESDRKYQSPLCLTITVLGWGWDIRSSNRKTPPRLLQWTSSAGGAKCTCWHGSQWPRISRGHKYPIQAN